MAACQHDAGRRTARVKQDDDPGRQRPIIAVPKADDDGYADEKQRKQRAQHGTEIAGYLHTDLAPLQLQLDAGQCRIVAQSVQRDHGELAAFLQRVEHAHVRCS